MLNIKHEKEEVLFAISFIKWLQGIWPVYLKYENTSIKEHGSSLLELLELLDSSKDNSEENGRKEEKELKQRDHLGCKNFIYFPLLSWMNLWLPCMQGCSVGVRTAFHMDRIGAGCSCFPLVRGTSKLSVFEYMGRWQDQQRFLLLSC